MGRTAVVAGSTGLVGNLLLKRLLQSRTYTRVIALARQPLGLQHAKLEVVISTLEEFESLQPKIVADDAFCCLGTTQAKAGRVGLERVDYHMVVDFARAAHKAGAKQFLVVSAAGTSAKSLSFYSRTKARMEQAVSEIGFETVHILRPSLLIGERSESRPMESLAQRIAPIISRFFVGNLKIYRPVTSDAVADALLMLSARETQGVQIHHLPLST